MGYLQELAGPLVQERRRSRRSRVTCPATLLTLTGEFEGELWDLSETGARLAAPDLPVRSTRAMLQWRDQKHACTVIWTDGSICGLEFEEPIGELVVSECARLLCTKEEPIAEVANIPLGKRRSSHTSQAIERELGRLVRTTTLVIGKPKRGANSLDPAFLSASEEMFFWGSPLAHIVAFRELKAGQTIDRLARPGFSIFDDLQREFGTGNSVEMPSPDLGS
jgi:hypothetical protein